MSIACNQCGEALSPDDIFCGACGSKVPPTATESGEQAIEAARAAEAAKLPLLKRPEARAVLLRLCLITAAGFTGFVIATYVIAGDLIFLISDYAYYNFDLLIEVEQFRWIMGISTFILSNLCAYIMHLTLIRTGYRLYLDNKQLMKYATPAFLIFAAFLGASVF